MQRTVWVLILLVLTALFVPFGYALDLGPGPDKVRALTWEYLDAPWFSGVRIVDLGIKGWFDTGLTSKSQDTADPEIRALLIGGVHHVRAQIHNRGTV